MIYFFTLILVVALLNTLFKRTYFYRNKYIDTHKFRQIPNGLDVVNLGSNQPKYAFDYSSLGVAGMNWAIGPQTLEYDFRILQSFHAHLKPKGKVIVAISPFQFFLSKYKEQTSRHKYYNFLDASLIDEYSVITKMLAIHYPVLTAKKNIMRIICDVKPDRRLEFESNLMNDEELRKDAQVWIDGWKKQFQINDLENIVLSDEKLEIIEGNIKILKEMIAYCFDRDYVPVVLVLPVTRQLSGLFPSEFVDDYVVDYIDRAIGNARLINYWRDNRFEDEELYFNSFFMNKLGRRKFTAQVLKDLHL